MGVSGCGKSTVAGLLAGQLGWDFQEATTCIQTRTSRRWRPAIR